MQNDRVCPVCSTRFVICIHNKTYCTRKCRKVAGSRRHKGIAIQNDGVRLCKRCHHAFADKRNGAEFCSKSCNFTYWLRGQQGLPQGDVIRKCDHCGEWMHGAKLNKLHCSPSCRTMAYYKRQKETL